MHVSHMTVYSGIRCEVFIAMATDVVFSFFQRSCSRSKFIPFFARMGLVVFDLRKALFTLFAPAMLRKISFSTRGVDTIDLTFSKWLQEIQSQRYRVGTSTMIEADIGKIFFSQASKMAKKNVYKKQHRLQKNILKSMK